SPSCARLMSASSSSPPGTVSDYFNQELPGRDARLPPMTPLFALLSLVNGLTEHDPFRAVADRMRPEVVLLRSRALLGVRGQEDAAPVQAELTGSGVLIGKGLALGSLHLAVLPDVEGKLSPVESVEILV